MATSQPVVNEQPVQKPVKQMPTEPQQVPKEPQQQPKKTTKTPLIHKLFEGTFQVGKNIFNWKGMNDFGEIVSSGNYVYTLKVDGHKSQSRTMTFIK